MRSTLRWILRAAIAMFSASTIVAVADLFGYAEWIHRMNTDYPFVAAMFNSRWFPIGCLGVMGLTIYGEKFLKLPDLHAEFMRLHLIPDVGVVPLRMLDELHEKIWERPTYNLDSFVVAEIYVVNHSENSVTIREFCGDIYFLKPWMRNWPRIAAYLPRKRKDLTKLDLKYWRLITEETRNGRFTNTTHESPIDLRETLNSTVLERGIGYRGWLGFQVKDVDRKELDAVQLQLRIKDALGHTHPITSPKGIVNNPSNPRILPPVD